LGPLRKLQTIRRTAALVGDDRVPARGDRTCRPRRVVADARPILLALSTALPPVDLDHRDREEVLDTTEVTLDCSARLRVGIGTDPEKPKFHSIRYFRRFSRSVFRLIPKTAAAFEKFDRVCRRTSRM